eukprot:TRINITY_DN18013_c0_g1_i1.p1 TRINITY_DN18013_c0_g1~~TRINITY_DN18013_c0_g1_i1.p1  ORF type:complete len:291 (-),score=43.12 TRINITY_DN18013_c0_g1_i1:292-1164(-)
MECARDHQRSRCWFASVPLACEVAPLPRNDTARTSAMGIPSQMHGSLEQARGNLAPLIAIGANATVFGLWQLEKRMASPWLSRTMFNHAMCSMRHILDGRLHTLLLSSISHRYAMHFGLNAYGLYVFGSVAGDRLSTPELGAVIGTCGIGASMAHVLCQPHVMVLGASGALMGLLAVDAALLPERRFRMHLPVPGLELTMLQVADLAFAVNVIGFMTARLTGLGNVAWASHLGGTATGVGLAFGAARVNKDPRFDDLLRVHSERCAEHWRATGDSFDAFAGRILGRGRDE